MTFLKVLTVTVNAIKSLYCVKHVNFFIQTPPAEISYTHLHVLQ